MANEENSCQSEETVLDEENNTQNDLSAEDTQHQQSDSLQEEKIKELNERYLRLAAEYDNYKKRTQREKEAKYADAVIDTVCAILPVADNLERAVALEVESEEAKKVLDGVKMVQNQLSEILTNLGIKPIQAEGEQFDPNFHNAVMHVEDEGMDENVVAEELMRGYLYQDRVVRHSMVKVAN